MKKLFPGIKFIVCALIFLYTGSFIGHTEQNFSQRIISLGPSITEQLYLLKAQDRLVGCTIYCKRPKEAKSKEKVGTVVEVNLEKIIGLKPDLVLATSLTDFKAIKKLKNLGIEIVSFFPPKNFAEICEQFLELGKIIGKEKKAEEIISKAKDKINATKKKVKNLPKPKVFIQIGARPLFTVIGDSFVNDFIEFAGGVNIAQNLKSGFYSREKVIEANPNVIIIVTMGIVGEEEKGVWEKYLILEAVKNNRVYIIDSYKLCSPTPLSFADALEQITGILHPGQEK